MVPVSLRGPGGLVKNLDRAGTPGGSKITWTTASLSGQGCLPGPNTLQMLSRRDYCVPVRWTTS